MQACRGGETPYKEVCLDRENGNLYGFGLVMATAGAESLDPVDLHDASIMDHRFDLSEPQ